MNTDRAPPTCMSEQEPDNQVLVPDYIKRINNNYEDESEFLDFTGNIFPKK